MSLFCFVHLARYRRTQRKVRQIDEEPCPVDKMCRTTVDGVDLAYLEPVLRIRDLVLWFTPGFEIWIRDSGYGIGKNPDPGSGIQIRDERILFLRTKYQFFRFKILKFLHAISRIWDGKNRSGINILDPQHCLELGFTPMISSIVAFKRHSKKPIHFTFFLTNLQLERRAFCCCFVFLAPTPSRLNLLRKAVPAT